MGHKRRLAAAAKRLAGGAVRSPQRLRKRRTNEKAAKVCVEEVDIFEPEDEGPQAGGNLRGLANQLTPRSHAAPRQRNVRGKFWRAITSAQPIENQTQAIAHVTSGHYP